MIFHRPMNKKDRVSKLVWDNFSASKDAASLNLMRAFQQKQLKVDEASLNLIIQIVNSSIDEGFEKGHRVFLKALQKVLETPE